METENNCASKGVSEVLKNQGHAETNSTTRHQMTQRKLIYFMAGLTAVGLMSSVFYLTMQNNKLSRQLAQYSQFQTMSFQDQIEALAEETDIIQQKITRSPKVDRLLASKSRLQERVIALEDWWGKSGYLPNHDKFKRLIGSEVAKNKLFEWLWSSHHINCAVFEDDPSFVERNSSRPWRTFKEKASKARMNGFLLIIHDGCHPNMEAWHDELLIKLPPLPPDRKKLYKDYGDELRK